MGEVIRANFGGGRKDKVEEPVMRIEQTGDDLSKGGVLDTFEDAKFLIENLDRYDTISARVDEIMEFYTGLQGFVYDEQSVQLRMEELRKNSIEKLVGFLENSSELDWKTRPSFYVALVTEYNERTTQIRSLIGGDEEPE